MTKTRSTQGSVLESGRASASVYNVAPPIMNPWASVFEAELEFEDEGRSAKADARLSLRTAELSSVPLIHPQSISLI